MVSKTLFMALFYNYFQKFSTTARRVHLRVSSTPVKQLGMCATSTIEPLSITIIRSHHERWKACGQ